MRATVDVRGPRFAAAVTCAVLALALGTQSTVLLAAQVAVFAVTAIGGVRWSPYGNLFRWLRDRRGWGPPPAVEPAAGPRFSQILGGLFSGAGLVAVLAGAPTAGWALVLAVVALSGLLAASGFCVGCELHALARRLRSLGSGTAAERIGEDVRGTLRLAPDERALLLFTAPSCGSCVQARSVCEAVAADRDDVVVRAIDVADQVDLARDYGVLRAPTVLVANGDGWIAGRFGGVPRPEMLAKLMDASP